MLNTEMTEIENTEAFLKIKQQADEVTSKMKGTIVKPFLLPKTAIAGIIKQLRTQHMRGGNKISMLVNN